MSRTARILPVALTTALHLGLVFWIGATLGQGLPPRDVAAVMQVALISAALPTPPPPPAAPLPAPAAPPSPAVHAQTQPVRPIARTPAPRTENAERVKTASATPRPPPKPRQAAPVAAAPRPALPDNAPPAAAPALADRPVPGPLMLASADAVQLAAAAPPAALALQPPRIDASGHDNPKPRYPQLSRRLGEEGQVLLELLVREDGSVSEVMVRRSSGSSRLDQAALDAVRHWRYLPARRGGEAIAYRYVQPVEFALDD